MISKVDLSVTGKTYTEAGYLFTEAGDTLILKGSPVLGAIGFSNISIKKRDAGSLSVFLRYSVDSLNWNDWVDVSRVDISEINIDPQHFFKFEIKLVSNTNSSVALEAVEVKFRYQVPKEPDFYKDFPLSKHVPYYNYSSIEWSLNVLEKVYRQGIVPKYIERETNENWSDKDYIDFWFPIIYYLSLNLTFNKIFKDLVWYPTLLYEYLRQKGLYLGPEVRLAELVYLMEHYYSEIMKRGSLSCLVDRINEDTGVTLRSELSRLINKKDFDEFLMAIIDSDENGWVIGKTCCGFIETDTYKGYVKGYENTEEVVDISKYPLSDPQNYIIEEGKLLPKDKIFTLGTYGGIKPYTLVNPYNSYEISFKFKITSDSTSLCKIGVDATCQGFDSLEILQKDAFEGPEGLVKESVLNCKPNKDYYLKFCLYGLEEDVQVIDQNSIHGSFSDFNGLKFHSENVQFICPYIYIDGSTAKELYVWDIKVRLLDRKDTFLSKDTEGTLFFKNNNIELTNNEIETIIKDYLLSFKFNVNFRYDRHS